MSESLFNLPSLPRRKYDRDCPLPSSKGGNGDDRHETSLLQRFSLPENKNGFQ